MRKQGLQGVSRGRKKTMIPDPARPCPKDKVNRKFKADAPDQLWVADFTYVHTAMGTAYAPLSSSTSSLGRSSDGAFSISMTTSFVLDALYSGRPPATSGDGIFDPPLGPKHAISIHSTR